MPKGVVKCGNCEPWDLFRDGNKGLVYSISDAVKVTSDSFKSGFYYLNLGASGTIVGATVHMCRSCDVGEGSIVWAWGNDETTLGFVFIYQDDNLMDSRDEVGSLVTTTSGVWYQITIDENSGHRRPQVVF